MASDSREISTRLTAPKGLSMLLFLSRPHAQTKQLKCLSQETTVRYLYSVGPLACLWTFFRKGHAEVAGSGDPLQGEEESGCSTVEIVTHGVRDGKG